MEIGKKLKQARAQAGLTQEQAAEALFVSRQTVSNWETGKSLPDVLSAVRCGQLYGVSLDELLKGDTAMHRQLEQEARLRRLRRRLLLVGWVVVAASALLVLLEALVEHPVLAFLTAALPWVLLGVAFLFLWLWLGGGTAPPGEGPPPPACPGP